MANDQLNTSDETDYFLEYLLRCALTAPGADTSPTAGRILARLLVVGAVEGGDELITPYLVPVPGTEASFEVRSYQPGDLVPTDVREGLRAVAALKIALRSARDSDDGIEVVSRTSSGLERCVLVRDSTGDFEFRFAGPETLIGEPAECTAARSAWEATFATWRADVPVAAGNGADPRPVPGPPRPVGPSLAGRTPSDRPTVTPGDPATRLPRRPGWWVPVESDGADDEWAGESDDRAVADSPPHSVETPIPEPEAVAPPLASVSDDAPTPDIATPDTDTTDAPSTLTPQEPGRSVIPLSPDAAGDPLGAAIRDAIGNLVVEVDLSQVEQLIRRVLDDDRKEMVEPLARRLSARLGESLDRPDSQVIVDALSQLLPRPVDLAEAVAADVGALLSETVLRRRPGDPGMGLEAFNLMVGIEQLQVRLDGMQDQMQKSAGLLQIMGDHLEAGDRRAAIAERLSTSVDQEMQRLASRIDEQVSALASASGGGSELADGLARLTRKLRQSVAQFDRVLLRMDEMVDQSGGGQEPDDQEEEQAYRGRPSSPGRSSASGAGPARPSASGAGPVRPAVPSRAEALTSRRLPPPNGPVGPAARR